MPSASCYAAIAKKLSIYSTHYLDEHHPAHEQSEVDEAGTLSERVFKSKEMLLINLSERDILALTNGCCSKPGNQLQTLCLLPLMSGNTMLGVLKLAQCEEKVSLPPTSSYCARLPSVWQLPWITPSPTGNSPPEGTSGR